MDKLISKVESSIELINSISGYFKEFYEILTDKKIAKEIGESIRDIQPSREKLLKRLQAFNSKAIEELNLIETVTIVFQTYQLIREYEKLIDKIITQLNDWNVFVRPDIILSEISQTRLLGLSKESNQMALMLSNFKRKYEDHDIDSLKIISDFVLKKINYDTLTLPEIKSIQEIFRKYPLSIDIYAILLQTVMDQNKSLITNVLQIIEEDKSGILSSYTSQYTANNYKIKPVQNPSLRYFGLVPADLSKPLDKLFAGDTSATANPEQFLQKLAESDSVGIIYIKKFTANPIEFSIWNLTRYDDAAKFISQNAATQNAGMTKSLIERMKVINYADPPAGANKWKLSEYQTFGDVKNAQSFYILDSFNGKTFRIIKPWSDRASRASKVPRSYLTGLLTYIGVVSGPGKDRVSIYNEIMENTICDHMFLRNPIDIAELLSDVQAEMDAPRLKQEVAGILTKFIKSPKNWAELGAAVHNSELLDIFVDSLVKLYPTYFKDDISTDKRVQFPFSETLSTFLVELNNVKKFFGRALHEHFVKTPRDTQYAAFRSKDNTMIFIGQLIKASLDDVITNKSNVYSSLLMKNKILCVELNESDVDRSVSGGGLWWHNKKGSGPASRLSEDAIDE